jgi:hypothetical protein
MQQSNFARHFETARGYGMDTPRALRHAAIMIGALKIRKNVQEKTRQILEGFGWGKKEGSFVVELPIIEEELTDTEVLEASV